MAEGAEFSETKAGSLNLKLHFTSGSHTKENPWGVYITREVEQLQEELD